MNRRDFLRISGGATLAPTLASNLVDAAEGGSTTVLYDDRAITLRSVGKDPRNTPDALWVRKADLPGINGFEIKPQGACRAEVCVPIPKDMARDAYFNLTAFSKKVGQVVVADPDARVWSFGEIPMFSGAYSSSRVTPDFAVPDRRGRIVRLSDFRGKKVLVTTWASW
jgi:hypothetical protein